MPTQPEHLEHRHVEDAQTNAREAFYFRLFAGALCVAALTFGLLNLWDVIDV
jgi:hypothetical protein